MPLFSMLVVLFRGSVKILEKNLKHIDFDDLEIIIVDNSESDEYFNHLLAWVKNLPAQLQKKIKLYQARYNGGYTRGNNLAFLLSTGKYLLILNPDAELGPQFFSTAKMVFEKTNWAIIQPKIYENLEEKKIDTTYIIIKKYSPKYIVRVGRNRIDNSSFDTPHETAYAQGCCLLIRREVFQELNGFDERFFMYSEELDLCVRARRRHHQVIYYPHFFAVHPLPQNRSLFSSRLLFQNDVVFFGKNYSSFSLLLVQFFYGYIRVILSLRQRERVWSRIDYEKLFPLFFSVLKGFVKGWKFQIYKNLQENTA